MYNRNLILKRQEVKREKEWRGGKKKKRADLIYFICILLVYGFLFLGEIGNFDT